MSLPQTGPLGALDLVPAVAFSRQRPVAVAIFEAPLAAARNQERDRKQKRLAWNIDVSPLEPATA